jgi:type IV pilus assembly protein PilY1
VSTTGQAALYILFIEDGMDGTWNAGDVIKIPVPSGTVGQPNGLATPAVADIDGDNIADYIFAGDLNGNMWRFDVTSATPGDWDDASNFKAIFTAKDSATPPNPQPITSRPAVAFHPYSLPGLMVYFGTGKYLETTDASIVGATTQTFYGIWDQKDAISPIAAPTRNDLLEQEVLTTITAGGGEFRETTNEAITWRDGVPLPTPNHIGWYMDLPTPGERVFVNPVLTERRLIFATVIPSSDPCTVGGDGWLMCLTPGNGGRPEPCFDVNGDGTVDNADSVTIAGKAGQTVSGSKVVGIPPTPAKVIGEGSDRALVFPDSSGGIQSEKTKGIQHGSGGWGQRR